MAESLQKRPRQDPQNDFHQENPKRQKSINQILSILEQEEESESNQDLSDIFQSLQQEISSDDSTTVGLLSDHQNGGSAVSENDEEEEEDDGLRMMRRLLEASDDELGIPNRVEIADEESNSWEEEAFSLGDGIWEFEDYAANYYDILQSELFM